MDKKELKAKVKELLDSGKTKTEVFNNGIKPYFVITYLII